MTPEDVVHDSLADSLTGVDEPSRAVISAAAESVIANLADAFPDADSTGEKVRELRDALSRISEAYPGDHDYPGLIARAALGARV